VLDVDEAKVGTAMIAGSTENDGIDPSISLEWVLSSLL
jgi:hypothetical protein